MTSWINRTAGVAARNGTSSHTISFTAASSGSLLVVLVAGSVTNTMSTGGYTKQLGPVNNTELSVFTKTASAGESSFTVTHNASDYAVNFAVYEFAAGSTWFGGTSSANSSSWPTLSGLTGTNTVFGAISELNLTGDGTVSGTATSPWVEDVDSCILINVTEGDWLYVLLQDAYSSATATPADTDSGARTDERVVFAISVAASAEADPLFLLGDTWRRVSQAAYCDRRELPQQRAYVSDLGLLTTALLEVPRPAVTLPAVTHQRPAWLRQAPARVDQSTPAGTNLDPTLAGYGIVARGLPATHVDRRQVPPQRLALIDVSSPASGFDPTLQGAPRQPVLDRRSQPVQRAYVSTPDLLSTAQLENELLGGSTTGYRTWVFADRRQVPAQRTAVVGPDVVTTSTPGPTPVPAGRRDGVIPQQRAYVSPPGLLDTALIENELLGSADDLARHRWWGPRPWAGAQRAAVADQSSQPAAADPTTSGGVARWLAYLLAAWATDRREVPQQRAYVSDPSFYPTVAPTDPLSLAWGAGGTYWLLYNTAAVTVDRREVPQQRAYRSDPGLLSTALLEGVLLGSGDDLARHRTVFTDRRYVPAPRLLVSDPRLLVVTDPTTLAVGVGGDLWRRVNTPATHVPRWVLRTWRQALEFMGVPISGAVHGFAGPGDGLVLQAGPGPGTPSATATAGDGVAIRAGGG